MTVMLAPNHITTSLARVDMLLIGGTPGACAIPASGLSGCPGSSVWPQGQALRRRRRSQPRNQIHKHQPGHRRQQHHFVATASQTDMLNLVKVQTIMSPHSLVCTVSGHKIRQICRHQTTKTPAHTWRPPREARSHSEPGPGANVCLEIGSRFKRACPAWNRLLEAVRRRRSALTRTPR